MDTNLNKFKILYHPQEDPIMYTKLYEGRYAKTYMKEKRLISDIIDIHEYASALAHVILKNSDM